jgi:hypothetical protein
MVDMLTKIETEKAISDAIAPLASALAELMDEIMEKESKKAVSPIARRLQR